MREGFCRFAIHTQAWSSPREEGLRYKWDEPRDPAASLADPTLGRAYYECATITFLTGVIQGGASSPRIFIVFINALLEHLTCTGQALGISHGIEETEQFNNVAFMDDVTVLV